MTSRPALAPGLGVSKNMNVTVHFEATAQGDPYMFQLYAEVDSVSPAFGSLAGGTLLTLTGRGFPDLDQQLADNVTVTLRGGAPCRVVSSSYTTLTCVTAEKPAGSSADDAPINGLYPGMRGVQFDVYYNANVASIWRPWSNWADQLDGAITSLNITPASTVLTDRWVPPIALLAEPVEYWCSRSRAFFTATTAGPHVFMLSADDYASLTGTWVLSNGTQVRRLLANLLRWSEINNFYTVPTQMSQPIQLEVGQSILLEGAHCNTISRGHIQVGVLVPNTRPAWGSVSEYQQISIPVSRALRTVQYTYSWPLGSVLDHIVNLTFSSPAMPSLLVDPRVGFNLSLSNGRTITLPITVPASTFQATLRQALAVGNDAVGVSRFNSTTTLNFTLAVSKRVVPTFSANATMVLLPEAE
ncbi:uncharacterized protein HaLaN_08949, partial [Haematococcus lacustris]